MRKVMKILIVWISWMLIDDVLRWLVVWWPKDKEELIPLQSEFQVRINFKVSR